MSMSFGLKFEVPWEIGPKKAGFGDMALAVGFVFDSCLSSWAKVFQVLVHKKRHPFIWGFCVRIGVAG